MSLDAVIVYMIISNFGAAVALASAIIVVMNWADLFSIVSLVMLQTEEESVFYLINPRFGTPK